MASQNFKLIRKTIRERYYESESFRLCSFDTNPKNSFRRTGYTLSIKGHSLAGRLYFSTLKEAKEWANSDEAVEWLARV